MISEDTQGASVTVVTVVLDDADGLERTLSSLEGQTSTDWECVVIDGGSTDGTLDVVRAHSATVTRFVSEPDLGIYHAMNKGVALARGDWLLFMNAGDEFAGPGALADATALVGPEVEVVYADWIYREDGAVARASHTRMNVRHQSVMYRRRLHDDYGNYVVGAGVTISDFIFFQAIGTRHWTYCTTPLSLCDRSGVSGDPRHFHQRIAIELVFGRRSRVRCALILLLHPVYRFIKHRLLRRL